MTDSKSSGRGKLEEEGKGESFELISGNDWSRRRMVGLGASLGVAALVDAMLSGCTTRKYNTESSEKNFFGKGVSPASLYIRLTTLQFFDHYNLIRAHPEQYPDIEVPFPVELPKHLKFVGGLVSFTLDNENYRPHKIQMLLRLLILFRLKAGPVELFQEIRKKFPKIAVFNPTVSPFDPVKEKKWHETHQDLLVTKPDIIAPILALSHRAVVGFADDAEAKANPTVGILNKYNVVTEGSTKDKDTIFSRDSLKIRVSAETPVNRYRLLGYHPEMPGLVGHFMLDDDNIKRHDAEKAFVQQALPRVLEEDLSHKVVEAGDPALMQKLVTQHATDLVNEAKLKPAFTERGEIDVVQDVARWLPIRVVGSYFGIPSGPKAPGFALDSTEAATLFGRKAGEIIQPTQEQMYIWIANGFRNLFLNLAKDKVAAEYGRRSGSQLIWYVTQIVKAEAEGKVAGNGRQSDTMVGRLTRMWLKDKSNPIFAVANPTAQMDDGSPNLLFGVVSGPEYRIASNITGAVAGAGVTVEEAIARVFSVLTDPEYVTALEGAVAAAKKEGNFEELRAYYREALRFRPQAELIPRVAQVDSQIEGEHVPRGALVLASLYAAMHDDERLGGTASQFKLGRDKASYLEFGWQRNRCLGVYIAPVEIVAALKAILSQAAGTRITRVGNMMFGPDAPWKDTDDLRTSPGAVSGPYAHSLIIKLT